MKSFLSGVIVLLAAGSAFAGDLNFSMPRKSTYLINASAQSCKNVVDVSKNPATPVTSDIQGSYMSFIGGTLSWASTTDSVEIVSMDIMFDTPDFKYNCSIAGDELQALFYDFNSMTDWNHTILPAAADTLPRTIDTASLCRIRCGGASVPFGKAFEAEGTLRVMGIRLSPTSGESLVDTSVPVKVFHQ